MFTDDRSLPARAHLSALSRSARFAWLKPTGFAAGFGVADGADLQDAATDALAAGAGVVPEPPPDLEQPATAVRAMTLVADIAASLRGRGLRIIVDQCPSWVGGGLGNRLAEEARIRSRGPGGDRPGSSGSPW